jgi:hypothetical protein
MPNSQEQEPSSIQLACSSAVCGGKICILRVLPLIAASRIRGVYRFAYSFTQNGQLSGASVETGSTPIWRTRKNVGSCCRILARLVARADAGSPGCLALPAACCLPAFSFTLTNPKKTTIACRVYQTNTFLLSTKAQGATPSLPGTE